MGDLISRQAAIKAIDDLPNCYNGYSDTYDKELIIEVLEELQTEQPEQRWIPCSERLPEEAFGCLVTVWDSTQTGEGDDFENILPYFVGWDGEQWNDGDGNQCPFEVIAWQPLPEPYKESEE